MHACRGTVMHVRQGLNFTCCLISVSHHAAPRGKARLRAAAELDDEEKLFYEGRGAPAEILVSLLLGTSLLYLPLTAQSIGKSKRIMSSAKAAQEALHIANRS